MVFQGICFSFTKVYHEHVSQFKIKTYFLKCFQSVLMQPVWYDQGKDRTGREKGMDIVGVSKVGAAELSDSLEVGSGGEGIARTSSEFLLCTTKWMDRGTGS